MVGKAAFVRPVPDLAGQMIACKNLLVLAAATLSTCAYVD
jgi:hypothetical protein